jgi:hypothetical protein
MDLCDGEEWSEWDIEDLRIALEHGDTIEAAAVFLCRSGTVEEVRAKALELGFSRAPAAASANPALPDSSALPSRNKSSFIPLVAARGVNRERNPT